MTTPSPSNNIPFVSNEGDDDLNGSRFKATSYNLSSVHQGLEAPLAFPLVILRRTAR